MDKFEWKKGAIWLLPDGSVEIVPGFHDEWIASNQDKATGCKNVFEVVSKLGWLSVVAYSQGYVEYMIRSRNDEQSVNLCIEHLRINLEHWQNALIMTMDEEGYIKLKPQDFVNGKSPKEKLFNSSLS